MSGAVIGEARMRLAAALPGFTDATGNPNPHAVPALPLFHVRLTLGAAERADMGSGEFFREGQLVVLLREVFAPGVDAEAAMHDRADAAEAAILAAPPDLGGLVFDVQPQQVEVEYAAGEVRTAAAEIVLGITLLR